MNTQPEITYRKLITRRWLAELGADWRGEGTTKAAAHRALLEQIAAEPSDVRPHVEVGPDGAVWVLWRAPRAWMYGRRGDGGRVDACCVLGVETSRVGAIKAMQGHMEHFYSDLSGVLPSAEMGGANG